MVITRVSADGFKNLRAVEIHPDPDLTILAGDNAQGKTNLLEAVWLCTGCRSFRGSKDRDLIGFDQEKARVEVSFSDQIRPQTASFLLHRADLRDKRVFLNGVKLPLLSRLFGHLHCVLFTPEDLALSKGGPDRRRTFLDLSAAQLKRSHLSAVNRYSQILAQRNVLLKDISQGKASPEQLEIWDPQLAAAGSYISLLRQAYVEKLSQVAGKLYGGLTAGREILTLEYHSTVYHGEGKELLRQGAGGGQSPPERTELTDQYYRRLQKARQEDIRFGATQYGVHRDDLLTRINGMSSREYGSQGQQRSVALALKIAQAMILTEETGQTPVMLLDDVLSELDASRQEFILSHLTGMQIFVTCCDESAVIRHRHGKVFQIRDGRLI